MTEQYYSNINLSTSLYRGQYIYIYMYILHIYIYIFILHTYIYIYKYCLPFCSPWVRWWCTACANTKALVSWQYITSWPTEALSSTETGWQQGASWVAPFQVAPGASWRCIRQDARILNGQTPNVRSQIGYLPCMEYVSKDFKTCLGLR